jgi:hypothetical protein
VSRHSSSRRGRRIGWRSRRRRARSRLRIRLSLNPGLLGRISRPSVAREAWSRGWLPDHLRPRCSRERRPPSEPEQPNRIALPVECPVAPLCGTHRGSGWSIQHNGVPGTSRCGAVSAYFRGSGLRVEEAPRHGADVVEEVQHGFSSIGVDRVNSRVGRDGHERTCRSRRCWVHSRSCFRDPLGPTTRGRGTLAPTFQVT